MLGKTRDELRDMYGMLHKLYFQLEDETDKERVWAARNAIGWVLGINVDAIPISINNPLHPYNAREGE